MSENRSTTAIQGGATAMPVVYNPWVLTVSEQAPWTLTATEDSAWEIIVTAEYEVTRG